MNNISLRYVSGVHINIQDITSEKLIVLKFEVNRKNNYTGLNWLLFLSGCSNSCAAQHGLGCIVEVIL